MKKIAICTLNSKYVHASLSPWCLLAGLKHYSKIQVDAHILDATINQELSDIFARIVQENYDFIGFSCYIWNITQTKQLVKMLKEAFPNLPILLGGPEVSFNQKEVLLGCPEVDFVLSGEGERPFAQLVDTLFPEEGTGDFTLVEGLSYREKGEIIVNSPYYTEEEPPSPYCEAYFAQLQGKIAYMESSRGCPFSCAFCLSGQGQQGQKLRYFNLERVKKEIVALANSGTKTVKFIDRTFNSSQTHADAILTFLLEEYNQSIPPHICFHFELAGDILRESTLNLIEKMPDGYVQLEIGMQSFCAKTLEAVGRTTNVEKLVKNIKKLVSFQNHHLHIDLIAGLPYEDLQEFKNSFNTGFLLGADMLQLGFLKVLHGSEIGLNPHNYPCDYEKTPPYQVKSTPWLSESDLEILGKIEDCVDRIYNSGRFSRTLQYALEGSGLSPFDLFLHIANGLQFETSPSLDAYVDEIFRILKGISGLDPLILRDLLMLDRVETNSTANIPKSLMVQDPNLRKLKIALEQSESTATPKNGKRFVGILYCENKGVYVDYPMKSLKSQHFHQRYESHFVDLDILDVAEEK